MLPDLQAMQTNGLTIYPTSFANPFRPDGAAVLMPPVSSATFPLATMAQQAGQDINTTLLRSAAPNSNPGATPASPVPLFDDTTFDVFNYSTATSPATYASSTGGTLATQPARNAHFQYQMQQRLGNMVTNRSNVYAIWITAGYFEAIPTPPTAANPDGFQLGPEKGSDTGAFERHRAFYIFDRSVPMGFQRGEDLNVDDGILIERVIE
jgi:hypothetical protein